MIYLGGDIMSFGSRLAREYEYKRVVEALPDEEVYSPIKNVSINDKTSVTEEENNCLAERIVEEDLDRLWSSDTVVMCPEQHAIGSLCETGAMYGWKYMAERLLELDDEERQYELERIANKKIHIHYDDIRTNGLNEKDWRRSFSINQLLHGMILYISDGIEKFDDIVKRLGEEG